MFVFYSKLKTVQKHAKRHYLPPLRSNFQKYFFLKIYSPLIWNARLAPKVTFERYWWEKSGALQVTILCKVSRCLAFSRQSVGNHFYMAKWTLIYVSADKTMELVGWVSVINRAYPIKFFLGWKIFFAAPGSSISLVVGWSVGWSVGLWCLW